MSIQKPTLYAYAVKSRSEDRSAICTRIGAGWPHSSGKSEMRETCLEIGHPGPEAAAPLRLVRERGRHRPDSEPDIEIDP